MPLPCADFSRVDVCFAINFRTNAKLLVMPLIGSSRANPQKSKGKKTTAKCIRNAIATLVLAVVATQFWAFLRYATKTKQNISIITTSLAPSKNEFIMWSKDEAYMHDCEIHIKGNETWGKSHAPYVDKISAKKIVASMKVPSLNIIPTLAVFDKETILKDYTLEFMTTLKQPYIIKSAHTSGG